ncbi:LysR family transcriptional regulator [Rhodococcus sp. T2V]|uniref:LysR family transcriptional regulator n=1 Tax=Rhodococcus sp. T2V TaxID=3034164 RepID=UPI0023E2D9B2|nr:LysR family transcriptional regulator [Rhodococcus sp. T2V]MDF3310284.1 LysR family transcriptional regulator [Rhodococcus sp. T2V]
MNSEAVKALLPHLPVLVALGEVEHVTVAAAMLGMPQPTVSRIVRRLEKQLGTPLLEPDGRGVRLTDAGRTLVPYAQRALEAVVDGLDAVRSQDRRTRATVRIAFQTSLGEHLVPELIRIVRAEDPAIRFVLSQGARRTCLNTLVNGEADIALVSRLNPPPDGLTVTPLFEQPLVVLVPAEHPQAASTSTTIRDLASEPIITLKPGYGLRGSVDDLFARAGALPTIAFEGEDLRTVSGLVASGLGVGIMPAAETPPPGCAQIRLDDPRATRDIGAALQPGAPRAAVTTVLTALVALTSTGNGHDEQPNPRESP